MRCTTCFTLLPTHAEQCDHCGAALGLEAELEPSSWMCPRCGHGLFAMESGELRIEECKRCGGTFVDHENLARIIALHHPQAGRTPSVSAPEMPAEAAVVYLPCPSCGARMNRAIFGRKSGVIVDVCKAHGTWFDARELTACLSFIEHGGLERAQRQAIAEKHEANVKARIERRTLAIQNAVNGAVQNDIQRLLDPTPSRQEGLLDLMDILLRS